MKFRLLPRFLVRPALAFVMLLLGAALYAGYLQYSGNFHTVIAGELYRAAQPNAAELATIKHEYGIKTVINLRGHNPGTQWYDEEAKAAQELGLNLIDFRMSSKRELTQARAGEIIELMKTAPKPILIHCRAGADRTGLIAALYLAAVSKHGEDAAEGQISFRYGHVGLPFTAAWAMDMTFEALEPWLGFPNS